MFRSNARLKLTVKVLYIGLNNFYHGIKIYSNLYYPVFIEKT
jgi:hypothetical protein